MIWLLLGVLCSTWLVVSFKLFSRWGIEPQQTIIVNYLVCVITAWAMAPKNGFPVRADTFQQHGIILGAVGLAFVITFTIMALTVAKNGVTVASIMQKMSLIVSVVFSFVFYKDPVTLFKVLAVFLAIVAVVLSNIKPNTEAKKAGWLFPMLTLLGSGLCDIGILYSGKSLSTSAGDSSVISMIFLSAGIWGTLFVGVQLFTRRLKFDPRALWAGVVLGIPNYFSLLFLLRALPAFNGEGARLFPVSNLSVILVSTFIAILAFRERLYWYNALGIVLGIVAIVLILQ